MWPRTPGRRCERLCSRGTAPLFTGTAKGHRRWVPVGEPHTDVIPASSNHLWAPTVMLRRKAAATRRGRAVSQSRRHVWRDLWIVRGMTCSFSPPWVLCQPVQAGAHHLHGDALMIAVGGVEDVAGNQLDGLDHAHSTDRRPAMAGEVAPRVLFARTGPTASVTTARARSCAPGRRDLRRHPKCPVAQL